YVESEAQRLSGQANTTLDHKFPDRVEGAEVSDNSAVRAPLLAAQARDAEGFLAGYAAVGRNHLEMGQDARIDFEQSQAGAVVLADDPRFVLIAARQGHDYVLGAKQQIVRGQDQAVGANDGPGAAPIGSQPDRGRDVRRRNVRMYPNGRTQSPLQQAYRRIHRSQLFASRLGPRREAFK